jgi:UDP-N-acetylmuramoyl-tripeptide--D-alanyl-D-alanine ligase
MSIKEIYSLFKSSRAITTDSRKVSEGALFFALKGAQFNANAFAQQALENGCTYAIIDDKEYQLNDRCILVDDVLITLQELAKYHRQQLSIPIIGITGSNGKTTTKELLNAVLSKKYKVLATPGNYNNHIGVPLTMLSIGEDIEIAIIEMGANHAGEIAFLCEISQPDFGAITNIGKAHLEGFGSIETIIETKTALYRHLKKHNGIAFVDEKNALLVSKSNENKRILFNNKENLHAEILQSSSPFLEFKLFIKDKEVALVKSQLIGNYNLDNALLAFSIGQYFDVPVMDMVKAIEEYRPSNNRSQWMESKYNKLILDAYNANPSSIEQAIQNFASLDLQNKVVILGDMLELGDTAKEEHQKIIDLLKNVAIDAYLIGPIYNSCNKAEKMNFFSETEEAKKYLMDHPLRNKSILIKGSRGLKLESLVDIL